MRSLEIFHKIKEKKYFEALLLAEKNYSESNDDINALVDYVTILINLNKFEKAEDVIFKSNIKPESDPNLYYLLIHLYSSVGDVDKLRDLQEKDELDGFFSELTNVHSLQESQERREYEYYKNQFREILTNFKNKFRKHEKIFKKAIIQINNDSINQAKKIIKDYAKKIENTNLSYFLLAETAILEGKFDLARRRYEKLLDSFDDKYLILNRLGDIELSQDNPDKAKQFYNQAIELNPSDLNTTIDIIRTHIALKEFQKAKKEYIKACNAFPKEQLKWIRQEIENVEQESNRKYVNGLAWYHGGGNVVKIEIDSEYGEGELMLTGNMGYHLIDALHLAHIVMTKRCKKINKQMVPKDVLINIPNALVYIDGPSIGLAATIGMLSEILNKQICHDYAFTGEITLNGNIIPIGGLNWKLTAAYLNNIKTVFIPKKNFRDLRSVPDNVKSNLKIMLVSDIREVERYLWN